MSDDLRDVLEPYLRRVDPTKPKFKRNYVAEMSNAISAAKPKIRDKQKKDRLFKHTSKNIWKLCYDYWPEHVEPLDLSDCEGLISEYYSQVENAIKSMATTEAVSTSYKIYKIMQLLHDEGKTKINVRKSHFIISSKIPQYIKMWKRICEHNKWKFIARND